MGPLTSPCDRCPHLSQKISELQERISTLYQLRDEERIMNSLVSNCLPAADLLVSTDSEVIVGAASASSSSAELDTTDPSLPAAAPQPTVPGAQLGAKPKVRSPSSHVQNDHWTPAGSGRHGGKLLSRSQPSCVPPLDTNNKYSILDIQDFPPLTRLHTPESVHAPPSSSKPSTVSSAQRRGSVQFTPCPTSSPVQSTALSQVHATLSLSPDSVKSPSQSPAPPARSSSELPTASPKPPSCPPPQQSPFFTPPPLFPPSTLIVGDSIVKRIHFFNAKTMCYPGATVPVLLDKLPALLASLPASIHQIIVHVGSNDTSSQHSLLTQSDFVRLFALLIGSGKSIFFSGPIPTLGRSAARFSRILSLHTWLQSECNSHHIHYIHNFDLFWARSSLFARDGIHPSRLGSRMLAANIQYAVQSCK